MKRRNFLQLALLTSAGASLPFSTLLTSCKNKGQSVSEETFKPFFFNLLKEWCDGMLALQIINPNNPKLHGSLACPSCNKVHGRCMDAVFPFFYMADVTGEKKYLNAGISVLEWAENVTQENGSWTVIPNPKSWNGITVFGAIALAETLHHHAHLLSKEKLQAWTARLQQAADFIFENFTMTYTNINYGASALYALNLMGRVLKNETYVSRSREMAKEVTAFFTDPNLLLFGEGKPSTSKSAKGLSAVDLGYNVEESLNNIVLYAELENDEELLKLLTKSLESHLEFMLPDGAWDNSWGTRQAKWSYWGSRTTDGCQPGYAALANRNPAFGTAVIRNTELLNRCTANGLLHGGPHYVSHGVLPCVHHTFAHAKPLAFLLNNWETFSTINADTPLPRLTADGIKHFPEVDVWLLARDAWRATVSSYDFVYKEHAQQVTGGSIGVLYHNKVGLLFAASMAKYMLVEVNNQQENPGEDFALTPRIETFKDGVWYTNLYDLGAKVKARDEEQSIICNAEVSLQDEDRNLLQNNASNFELNYRFSIDGFQISAKNTDELQLLKNTALVLPVVSSNNEKVVQVSDFKIEITKPEGIVVVEANVPLKIKETEKSRIFNMVPGVEAIPILAYFNSELPTQIICSIKIK